MLEQSPQQGDALAPGDLAAVDEERRRAAQPQSAPLLDIAVQAIGGGGIAITLFHRLRLGAERDQQGLQSGFDLLSLEQFGLPFVDLAMEFVENPEPLGAQGEPRGLTSEGMKIARQPLLTARGQGEVHEVESNILAELRQNRL